jgi:hypothetical protein
MRTTLRKRLRGCMKQRKIEYKTLWSSSDGDGVAFCRGDRRPDRGHRRRGVCRGLVCERSETGAVIRGSDEQIPFKFNQVLLQSKFFPISVPQQCGLEYMRKIQEPGARPLCCDKQWNKRCLVQWKICTPRNTGAVHIKMGRMGDLRIAIFRVDLFLASEHTRTAAMI